MVRLTLTHDLDQLHQDLVEMATRAETAIEESIQALNRQDAALARSVIAGDDVVDELERAIEHRCLNILARHQPLARDLRAVSAALKVITDLERISDGATDIGEIVLRLAGQAYIKPLVDIPRMAELATSMVRDSISAYIQKDQHLAMAVTLRDDEMDAAFERILMELTHMMREHPESVAQAVDFLFIAKYLERMGDHATNIAEWVIYLVTGVHPQDKELHEAAQQELPTGEQ
ncbi:phosphate signaling complex protein PhoU [Christensenellaceae bacterium NSJ-44]|uniref:Phosphate-specific transport system accessory protein PhoU n=1 Tax=Luoshenia tenuis TaxID=2763654 RepID=A0A926HNI6_9FIRM|nr:phosphate signaling complex protein PhoU [Luoshenia tenuis]MBC8529191.1 phosphate signaling complex protein PhoU [Luoshenia tenuis]